MELDLRLREIRLPGDILLRCRPMTQGATQRFYALVGRNTDLKNILTSESDAAALLALLKESLVALEGVTVRQADGSTRPGTLDDFTLTGGVGTLSLLMRALIELARSSSLSEADLKNLLAQPITAQQETPKAPTN